MRSRSGGGSFGFIVLLIAGAIVVILTLRSWIAVAPTAVELSPAQQIQRQQDQASQPVETMPSGSPGPAARPFSPSVTEMQAATDAHSQAVQQASAGTE